MDFESAADNLKGITETGMSQISKLATMASAMEEDIVRLKAELKEREKAYREVTEDQLPAAMMEHNLKKLELHDGAEITVSEYVSASIPKDKQDEAFAWLNNNGHGDLIKNVVSTNFVRGQEQIAEDFADELNSRGLPVNTRKWVEPMTLKAFAKEQISIIPMDTFGVYVGYKTKIKRKER